MTRTFPDTTRMARWLAAAALTLLAAPLTVTAQRPMPTARNAAYFEIGGNAILYSLNYERRFADMWSGRAGLMIASVSATDLNTGDRADVDLVLLPVMMNALLGRGAHRLELGGGPLFAIAGGRVDDAELGSVGEFAVGGIAGVTTTIGYRRQPVNGGFVFRAALSPFISGDPGLWAGLSAGWSF